MYIHPNGGESFCLGLTFNRRSGEFHEKKLYDQQLYIPNLMNEGPYQNPLK